MASPVAPMMQMDPMASMIQMHPMFNPQMMAAMVNNPFYQQQLSSPQAQALPQTKKQQETEMRDVEFQRNVNEQLRKLKN